MIKVLKFGGASIRDSKRIKNVTKIIKDYNANKVIIVFSAIANITNLLEELVELHFNDDEKKTEKLSEVKKIHFEIMNDLFTINHKVFSEIEIVFNEISEILLVKNNCLFSKLYDKMPGLLHRHVHDVFVGAEHLVSDIQSELEAKR